MKTRVIKIGNLYYPQYLRYIWFWKPFVKEEYTYGTFVDNISVIVIKFRDVEDAIKYCIDKTKGVVKDDPVIVWESDSGF